MRLLAAAALVGLSIYMAPWPTQVVDGRKVLKSKSGYQTVSLLDGGRTGLYYDYGEVIGRMRPEAKKVVLLGLGGGEMLRAARRTLPDAEMVGVELSPLTAALAKSEFHVDAFGVKVVVEDAANYIDKVEPGSVDGLMVDVFDDINLPLYFRSPVFFRACHKALSPRGILVMNVFPVELGPEVVSAIAGAGFSKVASFRSGPNEVLVAER